MKKFLKFIKRLPLYILLAVLFLFTFLYFSFLYDRNSYNSEILKEVTVQPIIIKGEHIDNNTIRVIENNIKLTSEKWKELTGFDLIWEEIEYIERPEGKVVYSISIPYLGDIGTGEANRMVEELYEGKPLIVFVEDIYADDSESLRGTRAFNGLGAVVKTGISPKNLIHELGHVFGLWHYFFKDNLMYEDGDVSTEELEKDQVGRMKRKIRKKNWGKK